MPDMNDWNQKVIAEFRANQGRVSGQFEGAPMVLLTTKGHKSGNEHTTPLMSQPHNGRLFVFASKGGAPTNPHWYNNLVANDTVTVEAGTEKYQAKASEVKGAERDEIYDRQKTKYPGFADYEKATTRKIPVVELTRIQH